MADEVRARLMDYCTVFGSRSDQGDALEAVRATVKGQRVTVAGALPDWSSVMIAAPDQSMRLTAMRPVKPGDEFSRLLLGAHNHFKRAVQLHGGDVTVVKRLLSIQFAIGVVVEPSWKSADWMEQVLMSVTRAVDGMIFDGSSLIAPDGTVLLNSGPQT